MRFLWLTGSYKIPMQLDAKDRDEAYRKAIGMRLSEEDSSDPAAVENARRWFRRHDQLIEMSTEVSDWPPYEGPLPEFDSEGLPF